MANVTRLPSEKKVLPETDISLQEEYVELATFKGKHSDTPEYIFVKILSHNRQGVAYVTSEELKVINRKKGNNIVIIKAYDDRSDVNPLKLSENLFA